MTDIIVCRRNEHSVTKSFYKITRVAAGKDNKLKKKRGGPVTVIEKNLSSEEQNKHYVVKLN